MSRRGSSKHDGDKGNRKKEKGSTERIRRDEGYWRASHVISENILSSPGWDSVIEEDVL